MSGGGGGGGGPRSCAGLGNVIPNGGGNRCGVLILGGCASENEGRATLLESGGECSLMGSDRGGEYTWEELWRGKSDCSGGFKVRSMRASF